MITRKTVGCWNAKAIAKRGNLSIAVPVILETSAHLIALIVCNKSAAVAAHSRVLTIHVVLKGLITA